MGVPSKASSRKTGYSMGMPGQNGPKGRTVAWNGAGGGGVVYLKGPSLLHSTLIFLARALRKALTHLEMRRAARRPNLPLKVKPPLIAVRPPVPLSAPSHPASTNEPIVLED